MFSNSTHKKHWLFTSKEQIDSFRQESNEKFIRRYCQPGVDDNIRGNFLSPQEEHQLCQMVEETAQRFCSSFNPPLLPSVIYTGFVFFKRFYLHNSVMEYLAKNIMMSCLYLASKVDEFNISIGDFVHNLKSGTPASNTAVILSLEAPIMRHLHYHLIVHCPYRPLEGQFIEMKTQCPGISKVESMRTGCEEFLWRSLLSDVCFLFTPSQISLASILHSGEKLGYDVYKLYIVGILCNGDLVKADDLTSKLRNCINMVTSVQTVTNESAAYLQSRAQQYMALLDQLNTQRAKRKLDQAGKAPHAKRVKSGSSESTGEESETDDED